jgi:plasmid stabilization system protein ParE
MAYRVLVARSAELDVAETIGHIATDSPRQAGRWLDGLLEIIDSLRDMPGRYAQISESEELGRPLRAVVYRSHRVVYFVDEAHQEVYVVRVYHCARRPLTLSSLELRDDDGD